MKNEPKVFPLAAEIRRLSARSVGTTAETIGGHRPPLQGSDHDFGENFSRPG